MSLSESGDAIDDSKFIRRIFRKGRFPSATYQRRWTKLHQLWGEHHELAAPNRIYNISDKLFRFEGLRVKGELGQEPRPISHFLTPS